MKRLVLCLLMPALLAGAPVLAADNGRIVLHNHLAACMKATAAGLSPDSSVVAARIDFHIKKPIGACGCFSALVAYSSSLDPDGSRQLLLRGQTAMMRSGQRTLVLAADPARVKGKDIHVQLSCAPPS